MDTSDPLIGPAQQIFSLSRLGKLTNFLTAPSSAEEFEVSFKNVSILAIDDNEKFLNACARFLNHEGFKAVSTMNNGIDGVGAVAKDKPDVVLLDLNMPEFSGFDVLEDLRSRTLDPKVI
ncbi:MAG: response regulator, partial [Rhodobacter sp.]|nr:response regulator [Rhodobacter sp.]